MRPGRRWQIGLGMLQALRRAGFGADFRSGFLCSFFRIKRKQFHFQVREFLEILESFMAAARFDFALFGARGRDGKLEEELRCTELPGRLDASGQDDLVFEVQDELVLLDEVARVVLEAEVVVEGGEQGEEAAAEEKAAIIFLAGAVGRETFGKVFPT